MRIIVCLKQGLDPKTVKISRSREEFDLREAMLVTHSEDKAALEAALRLREAEGGEVLAITVGRPAAEDSAHEAVAMGADKAIFVPAPENLSGRSLTTLILAVIARLGGADLILAGRAPALDTTGPLAPRLAAELGIPLLLDVVAFEASASGIAALVSRGDAGLRIPVALPAAAEVIRGVDRPRYPHPSRIAVAWDPGRVETWTLADLGIAEDTLVAETESGNLVLGAERQRGQTINGEPDAVAAELVGILRARRLI